MPHQHRPSALRRAQPRVLLIDDDPRFLRATETLLSPDYDVSTLNDPRRLTDAKLNAADVVVCDYKMPFADGHEILGRTQARTKPIPLILVSAFADKTMAIHAANLHVFAIFEKPLPLDDFQATLARACNHSISTGLQTPQPSGILREISDIKLCPESLTANGVRLTLTEFKLLEIFLTKPGSAIHRDTLIETVWGKCILTENVLDTHLSNLKRKLLVFSQRFQLIRGRGYIYYAKPTTPTG